MMIKIIRMTVMMIVIEPSPEAKLDGCILGAKSLISFMGDLRTNGAI